MYELFKFLHLLGVALLLGNVTATAVWKVFADRTSEPGTIAFAQRMVTLTDWSLTSAGICLLAIGGYGMAVMGGFPLLEPGWLLNGQLLFFISGGIWLAVLLPIQTKQAAAARRFSATNCVPAGYRRLGRYWIGWGVVATVPLVAAMWVMIQK